MSADFVRAGILRPDSAPGGQVQLPQWFVQPLPRPEELHNMRGILKAHGLHTVCTGARCPNLGQCWNRGHATFLILGDRCTRSCLFCAVPHGVPARPLEEEPGQVAAAVRALGLKYVVITSVTRDDLEDEGAGHFSRTVREVRALNPGVLIEVLVPDFSARRECYEVLAAAGADVIGHNLETVRRIAPLVRSAADHDRSLAALAMARHCAPQAIIKSGLMAGLGETDEEIFAAMQELRAAGCQILTVGQYLAPAGENQTAAPAAPATPATPVMRYVHPDIFAQYRVEGLRLGFEAVMAGPLVRSSYLAQDAYWQCRDSIKKGLCNDG